MAYRIAQSGDSEVRVARPNAGRAISTKSDVTRLRGGRISARLGMGCQSHLAALANGRDEPTTKPPETTTRRADPINLPRWSRCSGVPDAATYTSVRGF